MLQKQKGLNGSNISGSGNVNACLWLQGGGGFSEQHCINNIPSGISGRQEEVRATTPRLEAGSSVLLVATEIKQEEKRLQCKKNILKNRSQFTVDGGSFSTTRLRYGLVVSSLSPRLSSCL